MIAWSPDVIAVFMEEEIRARKFPEFVDEARSKNALLLLPHPYFGHRAPEKIAPQCDLIEVVNCRTRETPNRKAAALAEALGKRIFAGTDAHFARSIANAVVEVEDLGSLRASLLSGNIWWATPHITSRWEYGASQFVKAWKRHDLRLAFRLVRSGWTKILGGMRARLTPSRRNARKQRWTSN